MKIFIDPGHNYPPDLGAVGILKEDEETIKVARELDKVLSAAGHDIRLTDFTRRRVGGEQESLDERCRQSNDWGAEIFVSIHFNAYRPTSASMGAEVYAATSPSGHRLAGCVVANLARLGFKNRGAKDGSRLGVIKGTKARALLVEVCFIDSVDDVALYRRIGPEGVARAIASGLELKAVSPPAPTPLPSVGPAAVESSPRPVQLIPVDASTIYYKLGDIVDWAKGAARISEYFTVGEVTQWEIRRAPARGSAEEKAIFRLAIELDKVRSAWGKPLVVTSWHRPPTINRAVGGVRDSQHIHGRAVDIAPIKPSEIHEFQRWIDARWDGALGYGAKKGFVHLDDRNGRGFLTGGPKGVRWNY